MNKKLKPTKNNIKRIVPLQFWEYKGFFIEALIESEELHDVIGPLHLQLNKWNNKLEVQASVRLLKRLLIDLSCDQVKVSCYALCDCHKKVNVSMQWSAFCLESRTLCYHRTVPDREARNIKGCMPTHEIDLSLLDVFKQLKKEHPWRSHFQFEPVPCGCTGILTAQAPAITQSQIRCKPT